MLRILQLSILLQSLVLYPSSVSWQLLTSHLSRRKLVSLTHIKYFLQLLLIKMLDMLSSIIQLNPHTYPYMNNQFQYETIELLLILVLILIFYAFLVMKHIQVKVISQHLFMFYLYFLIAFYIYLSQFYTFPLLFQTLYYIII